MCSINYICKKQLQAETTNKKIRVRIKRIAIAKCVLFFHYCDSKEISFFFFSRHKTYPSDEKNTREFHLYCWDHVCKVN